MRIEQSKALEFNDFISTCIVLSWYFATALPKPVIDNIIIFTFLFWQQNYKKYNENKNENENFFILALVFREKLVPSRLERTINS
jgi:hypothetical protein